MKNVFECQMCGGEIKKINDEDGMGRCEFCGKLQPIPKNNEDMFNKANRLRRNEKKFDQALKIYENISKTSPDDAEAYWGIVLCRFGIEYVKEPLSDIYVPTCHRTMETSILKDTDYLSAIEYADDEKKKYYESQAAKIDVLQRQILDNMKNIEPYDVFISFKATDSEGDKTKDYNEAFKLYNQLMSNGFRVFFSEVTLKKEYLGQAYEPIIYSALRTAKVMVLVSTSMDYLESPWVLNEWSRYLRMMDDDKTKVMFGVFTEALLNENRLPMEIAALSHANMEMMGYEQTVVNNVIEHMKRCGHNNASKKEIRENLQTESESLLLEATNALKQRNYIAAAQKADQALIKNSEAAEGYWIRLLARLNRNEDEIQYEQVNFDIEDDFTKCCEYADDTLRAKYFSIKKICEDNMNYQKSYNQEYDSQYKQIFGEETEGKLKEIEGNIASTRTKRNAIKLPDMAWIIVGIILELVTIGFVYFLETKEYNVTLMMSTYVIALITIILTSVGAFGGRKALLILLTIAVRIGLFFYVDATVDKIDEGWQPADIELVYESILFIVIFIEKLAAYIVRRIQKSNREKEVQSLLQLHNKSLDELNARVQNELAGIDNKYASNANPYQKHCLVLRKKDSVGQYIAIHKDAVIEKIAVQEQQQPVQTQI